MKEYCFICLICVIISFCFCTLVFYKSPFIPYSALYKYGDNDKVLLERLYLDNEKRYTESNNYLSSLNLKTFEKYNFNGILNSHVELSVVFVSVKRKITGKSGYLVQSVAHLFKALESFLDHVGPLANQNIKITLCNVNKKYNSHKELLKLSKYIHTITKYNHVLYQNVSSHEKESLDYQFCLKNIKKIFNPKYMLVLQDDALVHSDIFGVLNEKLQYLNTKWPKKTKKVDMIKNDANRKINGNNSHDAKTSLIDGEISSRVSRDKKTHGTKIKTDWLLLKLFYPTKWGGYGLEFGVILELISLAIVCSSLLTLTAYIFYYILSKIIVHKIFNKNVFLVYQHFIVLFFVFVITFLMLGRTTIMRWRTLFPVLRRLVAPPGCCIPAVFYNSHNVGFLLNYLARHSGNTLKQENPVDLLIDDFIASSQFVSYLIEPNAATHIGYHSSLQHTKDAVEFV